VIGINYTMSDFNIKDDTIRFNNRKWNVYKDLHGMYAKQKLKWAATKKIKKDFQTKILMEYGCPFKFQVQLFTPKKEKSVTVKQTGVV
jgi:hypothetical protein